MNAASTGPTSTGTGTGDGAITSRRPLRPLLWPRRRRRIKRTWSDVSVDTREQEMSHAKYPAVTPTAPQTAALTNMREQLSAELIEHIVSFIRSPARVQEVLMTLGWPYARVVRFFVRHCMYWRSLQGLSLLHQQVMQDSLQIQHLACFRRVYAVHVLQTYEQITFLLHAGEYFVRHVLEQLLHFFLDTDTFLPILESLLGRLAADARWHTLLDDVIAAHSYVRHAPGFRQVFAAVCARALLHNDRSILAYGLETLAALPHPSNAEAWPLFMHPNETAPPSSRQVSVTDVREIVDIHLSDHAYTRLLTGDTMALLLAHVQPQPYPHAPGALDDLVSSLALWSTREALVVLCRWYISQTDNVAHEA